MICGGHIIVSKYTVEIFLHTDGSMVKLMSNLDFPHCHNLRSNLRVIKDLGGPRPPGTIHKYRAKIGYNVIEFTHSNWMTKSYYSIPKHKESASIDSQYNSLTSVALHNII